MAHTGYLYDDRYTLHDTGMGHPERPERVKAIHEAVSGSQDYHDLVLLSPRMAAEEEIGLVHAQEYIRRVRDEITGHTHHLDSLDTPVCERSYEIARLAAGGALDLCDSVMQGTITHGFGNIRPPGHHAERTYAAGFCIFNNVAIAAEYLKSRWGVEKIAIIDWDVHHGNGTQHFFEKDNSVYYVSFHQFPHYPGTGGARERGRGAGTGYTMNIPMGPGSGDRDYLRQLNSKVLPALENFEPQVVLVSAGFDAHELDPLSSIKLTTEMYYIMTKKILFLAKTYSRGRVVALLEGGYNLEALRKSVLQMMGAFIES